MGVVLDLPQSLIEAFSLVGFPVLIFPLVVGKQVLGSQKGSGERNHDQSQVSQATLEAPVGKNKTSRGHLRFVCTKEENGVLVGWGLHGTISYVIDL